MCSLRHSLGHRVGSYDILRRKTLKGLRMERRQARFGHGQNRLIKLSVVGCLSAGPIPLTDTTPFSRTLINQKRGRYDLGVLAPT